MFRIQIYLIIFLSLVVGNSVWAQKNWTLTQCISYAIENNINLKEYEILEKISLEDVRQSRRNMLPGISASTSAGLNFGRSIDPNTNAYVDTEFFNNSYGLSSSIAVFNGFRIQNRIQYQKFKQQASEYLRTNATDNLAFEITIAFFDVVYYKGMLEIAKEQVEASELNLKTTERKTELGLKAKTDLLEMRANLEQEELNKIQIENAVQTATLRLKQLMNYVSRDEMNLVDEAPLVYSEEVNQPQQLFDQFTTWSPYYRSIEANLKATEKVLSLSRSELYPSVWASGSFNTGFYETNTDELGNTIRFSEQFKNNRNQYLGASLSIPIFNRWAGRSDVKKAKLEIERAKTNLEDEKQKMFFEMVNNLTELEAMHKEYKQYVKRSEVDELAYRAADRKFQQGLIDINDYYIAKNRLANTQSQVLRSRTQWEIKMKILEFYKGQRFWEEEESVQ
ncbi:TolC family protein [Prolixibacteraceae bacterium Z1-6]|uniref:TolC family protein n=1 Tax=Draconibacterium aestuarii TaxID=2998507 RepID=A0A9X3F5E5_9BACT|nr:TolC family protein [Prolixibacteraceae bacterium Z1-6]